MSVLPLLIGIVIGVALAEGVNRLAPSAATWFGWFRLTHLRTGLGAVFGLAAAVGLNLSTSDHSHHAITYVVWYGLAALALAGAVATTVLIERREDRHLTKPARTHANTTHANTTAPRTTEPLTTADRNRIASETGAEMTRQVTDSTLRKLDEANKSARVAAAKKVAERQSRELAERLADLYHHGVELRGKIKSEMFGAALRHIQGGSNRGHVEREREIRGWDETVRADLPQPRHPEWDAAATLPKPHPTRSLIKPTATLSELDDFLIAKLAWLAKFIESLGGDSP